MHYRVATRRRQEGCPDRVPGTVHESGEPIEWVKAGDPERFHFASLERIVRSLAVASVAAAALADHSGSRHDLAMCVGGVLARGDVQGRGHSEICRNYRPRGWRYRIQGPQQGAEISVVAFKKGDPVWGRPKLGELLGQPAANAIVKLLISTTPQKLSLPVSSLHDFYAYMPNTITFTCRPASVAGVERQFCPR